MRLEEKLSEVINIRLKLAQVATRGPWTVEDAFARLPGCRCLSCYETEPYGRMIPELDGPPGADTSPVLYDSDATFIAANDPTTIIRHCERDLKVLGRHTWVDSSSGLCGQCCDQRWPCPEVTDLAEAYGVVIGESL